MNKLLRSFVKTYCFLVLFLGLCSAIICPSQAKASSLITLPVFNKKIMKGQIIKQKDLSKKDFTEKKIYGSVFYSAAPIINKAAKINIAPGKPIKTSSISEVPVIKKNDLVSLVYQFENISLSTKAIAITDGAIGDKIKLRNTINGKLIAGVIKNPNTVIINGQ